jgi:ribosomal protein L22
MSPNTPGDPQKGKPAEQEQAEQQAAEAKEATAQEAAAEAAEAPPAADAPAQDEPGTPLAEGTAADVTGVGKEVAAAALSEGTSEPLAASGDDDPAAADDDAEQAEAEAEVESELTKTEEPEAEAEAPAAPPEAPEAPAATEAGDEEAETAAAEAETESDLAKTDEPEPDADAAEAPARRRRGRRGRRGRGDAEGEPAAPEPAPARRAPARADGQLVVVRAQAKYVRTSARKARLVCDHIRGKSVQEARAILAHTPRAVARDWSKLLESAIANAEHNHELIGDDLRVHAVHADEGPTLKRFRPRAMGRATRIRKRTRHLTITLTPKE